LKILHLDLKDLQLLKIRIDKEIKTREKILLNIKNNSSK
jgi:hypothetical protein